MTYFRRPELASQMANRILKPGMLDQGLRSGLFLSGLRRTGKTTFLQQDLIPELEAMGALVIYVDLWTDTQADPSTLVHTAIRKALVELQTPTSGVLQRLTRLKGLDIGALGLKFGFQISELGSRGGPTISAALSEVVDRAKTDVVLIVDEVQQILASEEGSQLLLAIKAARDAINPKPGTPGHFIFIGTGSHRAQVVGMTLQGKMAFQGAVSVDYPTLGKDYVAYVLKTISDERATVIPGLEAADKAFDMLGRRPEELIRALRQLQLYNSVEADRFLLVIAETLKSAAADVELRKIEDLGMLATAVFSRIASTEGDTTGLFATAALDEYGKSIGREVSADQVQRIAEELRDANIILRRGHGIYAITDPFVQHAWLDKKKALMNPSIRVDPDDKG